MFISCKLCKEDHPVDNMDNLDFICDECLEGMFDEFSEDYEE